MAVLLLAEVSRHLALQQQRLPLLLLQSVLSWQASPRPQLLRRAAGLLLQQLVGLPTVLLPLQLEGSSSGGSSSYNSNNNVSGVANNSSSNTNNARLAPSWLRLLLRASGDIPLLQFLRVTQQHEHILFFYRHSVVQLLLGAAQQLVHVSSSSSNAAPGKTDSRKHVLEILDIFITWERRAVLLQLLNGSKDSSSNSSAAAADKRRRLDSGEQQQQQQSQQQEHQHQQQDDILADLPAALALCREQQQQQQQRKELKLLQHMGQVVYDSSAAIAQQLNIDLKQQLQQHDWCSSTTECNLVMLLLLRCLATNPKDPAAAAAAAAGAVAALPKLALLLQLHPQTPLPLQLVSRLCQQASTRLLGFTV